MLQEATDVGKNIIRIKLLTGSFSNVAREKQEASWTKVAARDTEQVAMLMENGERR